MSDNLKKFLEFIAQNPQLQEKAKALQSAGEEDVKAVALAFAKEHGFELTEADFAPPEGELSEQELSGVAGGGECWCVAGGGGTEDSNGNVCACVALGMGEDAGGSGTETERCFCMMAGYGHDE